MSWRQKSVAVQSNIDGLLLDKAVEFFGEEAEKRWGELAASVRSPRSIGRAFHRLAEDLEFVDRHCRDGGPEEAVPAKTKLRKVARLSALMEQRVTALREEFDAQLEELRAENVELRRALQGAVQDAADAQARAEEIHSRNEERLATQVSELRARNAALSEQLSKWCAAGGAGSSTALSGIVAPDVEAAEGSVAEASKAMEAKLKLLEQAHETKLTLLQSQNAQLADRLQTKDLLISKKDQLLSRMGQAIGSQEEVALGTGGMTSASISIAQPPATVLPGTTMPLVGEGSLLTAASHAVDHVHTSPAPTSACLPTKAFSDPVEADVVASVAPKTASVLMSVPPAVAIAVPGTAASHGGTEAAVAAASCAFGLVHAGPVSASAPVATAATRVPPVASAPSSMPSDVASKTELVALNAPTSTADLSVTSPVAMAVATVVTATERTAPAAIAVHGVTSPAAMAVATAVTATERTAPAATDVHLAGLATTPTPQTVATDVHQTGLAMTPMHQAGASNALCAQLKHWTPESSSIQAQHAQALEMISVLQKKLNEMNTFIQEVRGQEQVPPSAVVNTPRANLDPTSPHNVCAKALLTHQAASTLTPRDCQGLDRDPVPGDRTLLRELAPGDSDCGAIQPKKETLCKAERSVSERGLALGKGRPPRPALLSPLESRRGRSCERSPASDIAAAECEEPRSICSTRSGMSSASSGSEGSCKRSALRRRCKVDSSPRQLPPIEPAPEKEQKGNIELLPISPVQDSEIASSSREKDSNLLSWLRGWQPDSACLRQRSAGPDVGGREAGAHQNTPRRPPATARASSAHVLVRIVSECGVRCYDGHGNSPSPGPFKLPPRPPDARSSPSGSTP